MGIDRRGLTSMHKGRWAIWCICLILVVCGSILAFGLFHQNNPSKRDDPTFSTPSLPERVPTASPGSTRLSKSPDTSERSDDVSAINTDKALVQDVRASSSATGSGHSATVKLEADKYPPGAIAPTQENEPSVHPVGPKGAPPPQLTEPSPMTNAAMLAWPEASGDDLAYIAELGLREDQSAQVLATIDLYLATVGELRKQVGDGQVSMHAAQRKYDHYNRITHAKLVKMIGIEKVCLLRGHVDMGSVAVHPTSSRSAVVRKNSINGPDRIE